MTPCWKALSAREYCISTVTDAHDRDTRRICDTAFNGPGYGVEQVIIHATSPFAVSSIDEVLAEPHRTAEIHAQHAIAAVSQPLMLGFEAEDIPGPGPTVNQQHQWTRLLHAVGTREIRHQIE